MNLYNKLLLLFLLISFIILIIFFVITSINETTNYGLFKEKEIKKDK